MPNETFLNPFTDYGFKKLFGEEDSKNQLISFINSLIPEYHQVQSLEYSKNEHTGLTAFDRKAIVDIKCKTNKGETIIIEVQKAKQNYFKDRSVYYSSFPIIEQAQKGEWDFELKAVYTIGILDFKFTGDEETVVHTVQLKDQKNKIFYDKLTYIYLTMPNFKKSEQELNGNQDKWLYLFKNMAMCENMPSVYAKDSVFEGIFEKARLAKLTHQEQEAYRESLKNYLDLYNSLKTAKEEAFIEGVDKGIVIGVDKGIVIGVDKGIAIGIIQSARLMLEDGMNKSSIKKILRLTDEQMEQI